MFMGEAAAAYFFEQALTVPEVVAAVDDRVVNLAAIPKSMVLPALLHYAEAVNYGGPLDEDFIHSEIRYVFRFVCKGESTEPIADAAAALRLHLNGSYGYFGSYQLEWLATGEWPITTVIDEGEIYRQLGVYYQVNVGPKG